MSGMTENEARSLFTLAGFTVIRIKALPDGYNYAASDERYFETIPNQAWWFVKTEHGWIEIGWRKRVIAIDWSDTCRTVEITKDDVTKDLQSVHAWGTVKALEYLTTLRTRLASAVSPGTT